MTKEEIIVWLSHVSCLDCKDKKANGQCGEASGKCREAKMLAIDAIEKAERYKWHDLRKDPLDLPKEHGKYFIAYIFDGNDRNEISYAAEMFAYGWHTPTYVEVIAWKEIEPVEEEEG